MNNNTMALLLLLAVTLLTRECSGVHGWRRMAPSKRPLKDDDPSAPAPTKPMLRLNAVDQPADSALIDTQLHQNDELAANTKDEQPAKQARDGDDEPAEGDQAAESEHEAAEGDQAAEGEHEAAEGEQAAEGEHEAESEHAAEGEHEAAEGDQAAEGEHEAAEGDQAAEGEHEAGFERQDVAEAESVDGSDQSADEKSERQTVDRDSERQESEIAEPSRPSQSDGKASGDDRGISSEAVKVDVPSGRSTDKASPGQQEESEILTPTGHMRRHNFHTHKQQPRAPPPSVNHLFNPPDKGSEIRYEKIRRRLEQLDSTMRRLTEVLATGGANVADLENLPLGSDAASRLDALERRVGILEHRSTELWSRGEELLEQLKLRNRQELDRLEQEKEVDARVEQERIWEQQRLKHEQDNERMRLENQRLAATNEEMIRERNHVSSRGASSRREGNADDQQQFMEPWLIVTVVVVAAVLLLGLCWCSVHRKKGKSSTSSRIASPAPSFSPGHLNVAPIAPREGPLVSQQQSQVPMFHQTTAHQPQQQQQQQQQQPILQDDTTWTSGPHTGELRNRALSRWS